MHESAGLTGEDLCQSGQVPPSAPGDRDKVSTQQMGKRLPNRSEVFVKAFDCGGAAHVGIMMTGGRIIERMREGHKVRGDEHLQGGWMCWLFSRQPDTSYSHLRE